MKGSVLLVVILSTLSIKSLGQFTKEGDIWYFGFSYGLDFKFDPPKHLFDGKVNSFSARSASISDEHGNLLFYTDGKTIWNREHEIMPNGTNITPQVSEHLFASIIVPHPGDGKLYFLFVAHSDYENNDGLHYSVIDLSEDDGKGIVIQKGIELLQETYPCLTIISNSNEDAFWVIARGLTEKKFYSYYVSKTGLSVPVISSIGSINADHEAPYPNQFQASPDGTRIARSTSDGLELYNFNAKTGVVSNVRRIDMKYGELITGLEFSPNSELLYLGTNEDRILQCGLYNNSELSYESLLDLGQSAGCSVGDLQLASNGKIYIGCGAGNVTEYLAVINKPNVRGLGCEYEVNGLRIDLAIPSLPESIQSYYRESPTIPPLSTCKSDNTRINIQSVGYADSLIWDFGDGSEKKVYEGITGKNVLHTYDETGTYTVKVKKYIDDVFREISTTVTVGEPFEIEIGHDSTLCEGEEIIIDAGTWTSYEWSTGDSGRSISKNEPGIYWVRVYNGYCYRSDTTYVQVINYPEISLGHDWIVCFSDPIKLEVQGSGSYSYLWSTGLRDQSIIVDETGEYFVEASNGRCKSYDTVNVVYAGINGISLPDTIEVRSGNPLQLNASGENIDTWNWIFGDGTFVTKTVPHVFHQYQQAGYYENVLEVTNNYGCRKVFIFNTNVHEHLFVPNVFTPNGDDKNETFIVEYNGQESVQLKIFNRWGKEIYSARDYNNEWDGALFPSGTYYYKLWVGKKPFTGSLTLLR